MRNGTWTNDPDERVAKTTNGQKYIFKRMVELEKFVIRSVGHELVTDLDMVICDRCGKGVLTVVERAGRRVTCRPCADKEAPVKSDANSSGSS